MNTNYTKKKSTPEKINNHFYNTKNDTIFSLKKSVLEYCINFFSRSHLYPSGNLFSSINKKIMDQIYSFKNYKAIIPSDESSIIILPLGHSSIYIVYKEKGILIDPVEGSPSVFFHKYSKQIDYNSLPYLHYIVYTHNHPDHYDKKTLEKLTKNYSSLRIIGPTGFKTLLRKDGFIFPVITELSWHETVVLSENKKIKLTSVPAKHWSQSNLFNKNKTLWCGWIISCDETNMYISGDTASGKHFEEIAFFYNPIAITIISIAPELPETVQKSSHLSPEEAFDAFLTFDKPIFIPHHWGSFAFGREPLKEPIEKIMTLFLESENFDLLQATIINHPFVYRRKQELQKINSQTTDDHIISSHFLDHT